MALTNIQRDVCRLIARQRIASGESYVAGGAALNTILDAPRISQDLDLFHDTAAALAATWNADRAALFDAGYEIEVVRERPAFVEAIVRRGAEFVILQWTHDSAFRFFPLVEHPELGLALHPVDLATNKLLALVGRVEARDWVDILQCHAAVQPLGYLAWAATGKDPGLAPDAILQEARRSARYSKAEIAALVFNGPAPDAADLSRQWRAALESAAEIVSLLPYESVGQCVMRGSELFRGDSVALSEAIARREIRFHAGSIRGAFPRII
ncbi:MAG TPA: hypothetical protein VM733_00570 [Thermoanaerobaculia bacterium]|nr:hypothetical protein [Thermoanaerobaculia bacterium]